MTTKLCDSKARGEKCGNRIKDGDFFFLDPELGTLYCRACFKVWIEKQFRKLRGRLPKTEREAMMLSYWTKMYQQALGISENEALERVIELAKFPPIEQVVR